jgi:hypothetical protein
MIRGETKKQRHKGAGFLLFSARPQNKKGLPIFLTALY